MYFLSRYSVPTMLCCKQESDIVYFLFHDIYRTFDSFIGLYYSIVECLVIFKYSLHLCQQQSSFTFEQSMCACLVKVSVLPLHSLECVILLFCIFHEMLSSQAGLQRTRHVKIWWCKVRTRMDVANFLMASLVHTVCVAWHCNEGETLLTFSFWTNCAKVSILFS